MREEIFKSKILEGEGCWELLSALRERYGAQERDERKGGKVGQEPEDNGIESEEEDGELEFVL